MNRKDSEVVIAKKTKQQARCKNTEWTCKTCTDNDKKLQIIMMSSNLINMRKTKLKGTNHAKLQSKRRDNFKNKMKRRYYKKICNIIKL